MKKNLLQAFIGTLLFTIFIFTGCSSQKNVAEVGDEKISKEEFEKKLILKVEYNYDAAKSKSLEDKKIFLNEIIEQRLRYLDGMNKRLDTLSEYKENLNTSYEAALTTSILNKDVIEPDLKKYYDMLSYDYYAAHILLNVPERLEKEDSIKTYTRAMEIAKSLNNGEDFSELAKKYSQDVATKSIGGMLGCISAGQTIPEFENTLFTLKENEFTKSPIRTRLGLQFIKVYKRIPHFDSVRVSQIFIADLRYDDGKKDTVASFNKLKELFNRAQNGEDFAKLASEYSEDTVSKAKGGDLGFFKRGKYFLDFENKAFELEKGQISGAIRSSYGWHILKVTDKVSKAPFELMKDYVKNSYMFSLMYRNAYNKYIEELKLKYNLIVKPEAVEMITKSVDTTKIFLIINPSNSFTKEDMDKVIATFTGGTVTVKDFVQYISSTASAASMALTRLNIINMIMSSCEKPLLLMVAKNEGMDKTEEFKSTFEQYKYASMIQLHNKFIIQPLISVSDKEIEDYYNNNKDKFIATDNNIPRQKTLEESKNEITLKLRDNRIKEVLSFYISQLKETIKIKINEDVLNSTFSG